MANTFISAKLESRLKTLEKKKSRIAKKENELVAEFESSISNTTIKEVFASIITYGQPKQAAQAEDLKKKYEAGHFRSPEILALTRLYKAVGNCVSNKEEENG